MPDAYDEALARLTGASGDGAMAVAERTDAYAEAVKRRKRREGKEEEEPQSSAVGRVIRNALKGTSYGLAAQVAGAVEAPEETGVAGTIASEVGSYVLDPLTYLTGGVGTFAAKQVGKGIVRKGIQKAVQSSVAAGTQLAAMEAVKDPMRQVAQTGGFDPEAYAAHVMQAGAGGALLGPAAPIRNPVLRAGAEVASMAATPIVTEGRLPTTDDWIHAAGTVGGFKLVEVVKRAFARARIEDKTVGPENAQKIDEEMARMGVDIAQREALKQQLQREAAVADELRAAGTPRDVNREELIAAGVPRPTDEPPRSFSEPTTVDEFTLKLAALAGKPVSRKAYMEATGAKQKDVPVLETRNAEAEAAAERIKQEQADATQEITSVREPDEQGPAAEVRVEAPQINPQAGREAAEQGQGGVLTPAGIEARNRAMEASKTALPGGVGSAVDVSNTTLQDRKILAAQGFSFTTDRHNVPMMALSQRQRAENLRQKVMSQQGSPPETADRAFERYRRERKYTNKTPQSVLQADVEYQRLLGAAQAERRAASGREGAKTRGARAAEAAAPQTPEQRAVYLPLHELPEPVATSLQAEAAAQLSAKGAKGQARITSAKARDALQKIIRDKGEDVGSEVQKQKRRLLEYLQGQKDFRTIYEKDLGVPKAEPDAIVDAYLKGADEQQIRQMAEQLGYKPEAEPAIPDWVTERQPGEVARPGLYGQETFDPLTGRQAELPLAALPERAVPDVPGQLRLEPSRLTVAAEKARADAEAAYGELQAHKAKGGQTLFSTGVDPKAVALTGKWLAAEVKAAGVSFADFVVTTARRIGRDATLAIKGLMRDAWEAERKNNPALEAAGDVETILASVKDLPDKPTTVSRPDLARPVQGEAAQTGLNVADTIRTAAAEPRTVTHVEANEVSNRMIAERGGELTDRLINEGWVAEGSPDTFAQIKILNALGQKGLDADFIKAGLNYRQGRTQTAQALEAGKNAVIETMTQPEQQAFFNREAITKPPEKVEKAYQVAKARETREAAEGTKPSGKKKTSAQIAEEWAKEVQNVRSKLASLGHDVDRALAGQLDPIAQREFVRDVHASKASVPDKLYEWWNNAILSGPATQTTNAIGNVAHAGWHFTAERMTEAMLGSIARGLGIKKDGATFGELRYAARAFVDNWGKSAKNFFETWHSEVPQFYAQRGLEVETAYGYRPGAIAGKTGKTIRTSWRSLAAVDDFVKTQVHAMEAAALAYRQAKGEGLKGEAMTARMRELLDNPQSEVNLRATDTAIRLAFQEKRPFSRGVANVVSNIPGGRYLIPFITTPFNIVGAGIRKSPFGSLKLGTEILKASRTGDWSHIPTRAAEQVLAWGATLALAYTNDPADPWITGGEDRNRKFSIKIGGQWYSYGKIEPFATTLGLLVDGINKIHQGADLYESVKAPFDALLNRVEDQTFFTGLSDFMKAARYQDSQYVMNWAAKFPSSWVPNLVKAPIRAAVEDVPERRVWGASDAERADRALRRGLQSFEVMPDHPKYDLAGRPVKKDGSPIPHTDWIWRTLSPVGVKRYEETIIDRILTRWNGAHPDDKAEFRPPNTYFTEKGETFSFTDAEYAQYVRESGRLTLERVTALHARGRLNMNNPTERDIERLRTVIESSRLRIRNSIKKARRKAKKEAA